MPVTKLLEGHDKFRDDYFEHEQHLLEALSGGIHHQPVAMMITCCDARIVPSLIVNADPGDLFVVRNIANLVPPLDGPQSKRSVGSAIEYAVHQLKVPHIIICGHTDCGGLRALLNGNQMPEMPMLEAWLGDAIALRQRIAELLGTQSDEEIYKQLVYENVVLQLEHLLSYPVVRRGLEENTLELHGWVYNVTNGRLKVYNPTKNEFARPNVLPNVEEPPSGTGTIPTTFYIKNETSSPLLMYGVTPQGVEEYHHELKPGGSFHQDTFIGCQWRIRRKRDGALVALVTAGEPSQEVLIRSSKPLAL